MPQKTNRPAFGGTRVKRRGKSPPLYRVTGEARQTPFGARPNRKAVHEEWRGAARSALPLGRPLDSIGNDGTREMAISVPDTGSGYRQNSAYRPAPVFSFLFLLLLQIPLFADNGQTASPDSLNIVEIRIVGRKYTRQEVILSAIKTKVGDRISQEDVLQDKLRLEDLGIFKNVTISFHTGYYGTILYIVIEESLNLLPIGGLKFHSKKYGEDDFWVSGSLDFLWSNFRGLREVLWLRGEIWDKKSIGVGWGQPFRKPNFFWCNFLVMASPHDYAPIDENQRYFEGGAGRWLTQNIRADISANLQSIEAVNISTKDTLDNDWFPGIGAGIAWDNRNFPYHTTKGHYISLSLDRFGGLKEIKINFIQSLLKYRGYYPVMNTNHNVVLLLDITTRYRFPPWYYRIYGGGEGSIRGFPSGEFQGYNNILSTFEYRIPLFKTAEFGVPIADIFVPALNRVYYLVEAALFTDMGGYWEMQKGVTSLHRGYGAGLRVWAPPLKRSAVADFAVSEDGDFEYHLYLDIEF